MSTNDSKYRTKQKEGQLYGPSRKIPTFPTFKPGTCIKAGDFRREIDKRRGFAKPEPDEVLDFEAKFLHEYSL